MNKKEALIVLIQNSSILDDGTKLELLGNIGELTDEEVDKLGVFLANAKKISVEQADDILNKLAIIKQAQLTIA